jgi:hypothetical protein
VGWSHHKTASYSRYKNSDKILPRAGLEPAMKICISQLLRDSAPILRIDSAEYIEKMTMNAEWLRIGK